MQEIRTIEDFRRLVKAGKLIGITDRVAADRVHVPPCVDVKEGSFEIKVIEGGAKDGRYYTYDSLDEALAHLGDSPGPKGVKGISSLHASKKTRVFGSRVSG